jgi:tRNA pseudouridine38-40 synthase
LPDDIAVIKAEDVALDFHSRFSAKSKVYRYTILNRKFRPAILRDTVYFFRYPLRVGLMRREAKVLLGRHNFKSFQAADKLDRRAIRTIKGIKIARSNDFINIDIEADGFLYNMVRNIVGTLIDIGRGKLPKGSMHRILSAKDRRFAGQTVPAKGLCLLEARY